MPRCLYCFFIILLCTKNLLSPVGWNLHRPCEQYRYGQWVKESNIIIIEPDPPPGLSLSVARSANSPASGEECNFSPVWAINILCAAASYAVIDAHIAVILVVFISFRLWLSPSQSTPPSTSLQEVHVHHEEGERWKVFLGGGRWTHTMVHTATKLWVESHWSGLWKQVWWGFFFHWWWWGGLLWHECKITQLPLMFVQVLEGSSMICERRSLAEMW